MNINIFDIFPVIRLDNDIVLRKIVTELDYLDYFNFITKPEVSKYLSIDDLPLSPEAAKIELDYWAKIFDRRAGFYWAIAIESSNKLIGTCGFNYWNKSHRRAEISYDLNSDYWGRGISSKAVEAVINFAAQEMQIQRIKATVANDNISSIRVLEKNVFKREGCLDKYGILHDRTVDFYMYARCW